MYISRCDQYPSLKLCDIKYLGAKTLFELSFNQAAHQEKVEFDIMFGQGISRSGEVLDMAVEANVVAKSGSWFAYGDTKLGQGRDAVKQMITDNPELMLEIEQKILEADSAE